MIWLWWPREGRPPKRAYIPKSHERAPSVIKGYKGPNRTARGAHVSSRGAVVLPFPRATSSRMSQIGCLLYALTPDIRYIRYAETYKWANVSNVLKELLISYTSIQTFNTIDGFKHMMQRFLWMFGPTLTKNCNTIQLNEFDAFDNQCNESSRISQTRY